MPNSPPKPISISQNEQQHQQHQNDFNVYGKKRSPTLRSSSLSPASTSLQQPSRSSRFAGEDIASSKTTIPFSNNSSEIGVKMESLYAKDSSSPSNTSLLTKRVRDDGKSLKDKGKQVLKDDDAVVGKEELEGNKENHRDYLQQTQDTSEPTATKASQADNLMMNTVEIESRLHSYGPYIRIYNKRDNDNVPGVEESGASSPFKFGTNSAGKLHQTHQTMSLAKQHQQALIASKRSTSKLSHISPSSSPNNNIVIDVLPSSSPRQRHGRRSSASSAITPSYPASITLPLGVKKVMVGSKSPDHTLHRLHPQRITGPPTVLSLSRPTSSHKSSRFARSSASSNSNSTGKYDRAASSESNFVFDPSIPQLPFLQPSNALLLYLKMKVFEEETATDSTNEAGQYNSTMDEKVLSWIPGSFVVQTSPFVRGNDDGKGSRQGTGDFSFHSILSLFNTKTGDKDGRYQQQRILLDSYNIQGKLPVVAHQPGYLLITTKNIYIAKPLFQLSFLSSSQSLLQKLDEQTKYSLDPSKHISILYKIPITGAAQGGVRIDVGPGRQYLAIHHRQNQQQQQQYSSSQPHAKPSSGIIKSFVFITRSRSETTKALEAFATSITTPTLVPALPASVGGPSSSSTSPASTRNGRTRMLKINQNMEWAWRFVQSRILLQPNTAKLTRILSYNAVWGPSDFGPQQSELSADEFDAGVHDLVSPVDFTFIKTWIQGLFLRYFKPVEGVERRGVECCAVSFVVTGDYVYVVGERMDVWPPPLFPPESMAASQTIPAFPSFFTTGNAAFQESGEDVGDDVLKMKKGLVADVVSPFSLMGVGRVREISRLERWRSWRLNTCHSETPGFKTLGTSVQNGLIGYHLIDQRISPPSTLGAHSSDSSATSFSATIPSNAPSYPHKRKEEQKRERQKQGNASGFLWWCRVYFGYQPLNLDGGSDERERPASPPTVKPGVGYWWDVCFRCRESCQEFMDVIVEQRQRIDGVQVQVVLGDD